MKTKLDNRRQFLNWVPLTGVLLAAIAILLASSATSGLSRAIAEGTPTPAGDDPAQEELSLASALPVVVRTEPQSGADNVDPAEVKEIKVTFSKEMLDGTWSWAQATPDTFPEVGEQPEIGYLEDKRTCVLPVKLEHGKTYAVWLNSKRHQNFKDRFGQPSLPYLLVFKTAEKK